jgi:hypothetical protein
MIGVRAICATARGLCDAGGHATPFIEHVR